MSQEYTQYIIDHRTNVQKAYLWLCEHGLIKDGNLMSLVAQNIAAHDLSKYQPEEHNAYDEYFYGKRTKEVGKAFNYAWLHHIHANPHHWQYWVLKHDDEPEEALEMPEEYVYEMVSDWWSFSFKTGNLREIFSWYREHQGMVLHSNTRKLVESILDKIKKILDDGEEANELSR